MSRSKNFTFTHNNYLDTNLEDTIECKYIIYGKEVGESGTPHLQGFVTFENARSLLSLTKKLPGCHLEVARNAMAAMEYCKKEGDFTERGIPPVSKEKQGKNEQERWKNIRLAAEQGRDDDIPEDIRFRNPRLIDYHRDKALKKRKLDDTEQEMLWYYGESGSGKSRKAREENPDAYLKMCNKWWDGYSDEEVVLIEDFDKCHSVLGHHLKIWADRYPFLCEKKGGASKIRPRLIIVTSNWSPEEIWEDSQTLEPLLRRFKTVQFRKLNN